MKYALIILFSAVTLTIYSQNTIPSPNNVGNIGIGTLSPGYFKLNIFSNQVDNSYLLNLSHSQYDRSLIFRTGITPSIQSNNIAESVMTPLSLNPSGGKVGIGSYTTDYNLDVFSNLLNDSFIFRLRHSQFNRSLMFRTGDVPSIQAGNQDGSIVTKLSLNPDGGYVGIGSYTANYCLDVFSNVLNDDQMLRLKHAQFNRNIIFRTGDIPSIQSTNNSGDVFTKLSLNPLGGNISVGSPNAGKYTLTVNGTLAATELLVTTNLWADYVFSKDYDLMPLSEVKTFIERNGHLPNVPSANEIEEKGEISIGTMQIKMMEKIEEITLYLLQLKEENELLKARIEQLELPKNKN